jgi:hypothetical protein
MRRFFPALRPGVLLGFILVLGLGLRLEVALRAPWYWDEGYVAELARSFAAGGRPQAGAFWEDGFFPLSTSWLAPLSAAPWAALLSRHALLGVRLWALFWQVLVLGLLFLLGRRLAGPRLGLLAALAWALLPFGVEFGARAFYHHFAVPFLLLGLLLGQRAWQEGSRGAVAVAALSLSLAVSSCYWLWWLPLGWTLGLAWRRPRSLGWALLFMVPVPLAVLLANVLPDPPGARWSLASLLATASLGGPRSGSDFLRALGVNLSALPFLAAGLLGALGATWRSPQRWAWPTLCLLLATLEPVRQRGVIAGMPYPFIPAAPLAALGLAAAWDHAWTAHRRGAWVWAILLTLAFARPLATDTLRAWSAEPARVDELKAFLLRRGPGLVCGLPGYNWRLRPELEVCEPFEVGAAAGRASGFYLPGAPASRFARPAGLDELRYAVLSREHVLGLMRFEGTALTYLEMERRGWPRVFDNRAFKVYENPHFGVRPDPSVVILQAPDNYAAAALQARRAAQPALERFAVERARVLGWRLELPDP